MNGPMTLADAAAYCGRSVASMRRAIRRGQIARHYRAGPSGPELVLSRPDLDLWRAAKPAPSGDQADAAPRAPSNRWHAGECIYCGEKGQPLTKEHIIPYSLNGEWVFEKASCAACAKITSGFERTVLKGLFRYFRAALNLKTRHRHPTTFPLAITRNGKTETIDLSPTDYGAVLMLHDLPLPTHLGGPSQKPGVTITGQTTIRVGGLPAAEIKKTYEASEIHFTLTYTPGDFARFLAKMAYGFAAARAIDKGGQAELARLRSCSYVLPAILGRDENLGMWIGATEPEEVPTLQEAIAVSLVEIEGDVVAKIRLSGHIKAPTYLVVVGKVPG